MFCHYRPLDSRVMEEREKQKKRGRGRGQPGQRADVFPLLFRSRKVAGKLRSVGRDLLRRTSLNMEETWSFHKLTGDNSLSLSLSKE